MPRIDRNQTFDRDGNLLSEEIVEVPVKVIDDDTLEVAKQNLRTFWQTFTNVDGAPTGTPTANQTRNAILSLIVAARWLYAEMDDEE